MIQCCQTFFNENIVINKQSVVDFLVKNYGENVIVNRRANYISSGILPLADTQYRVFDGKKVCFIYVYELKDNKVFFLVKTNNENANNIIKNHK